MKATRAAENALASRGGHEKDRLDCSRFHFTVGGGADEPHIELDGMSSIESQPALLSRAIAR